MKGETIRKFSFTANKILTIESLKAFPKEAKEGKKKTRIPADRQTEKRTQHRVYTAYSLQDHSKILESRVLSKPITSITRVK